jgi:undecaprenyl-diphosphatase
MFEALVLGALQGVTEWLPISSEGVVAITNAWIFDRSLADAVAFALWLHIGTAISALVVFRSEFLTAVGDLRALRSNPSRSTRFYVGATFVSGFVGLPLLIALDEVSDSIGQGAMAVVGIAMLATAAVQLRRPRPGLRTRSELNAADAILTGLAQGVAVLPGLSRSGATVAALIARGIERREALIASFILSVPASLGAAFYVVLNSNSNLTSAGIAAAAIAAVIGIAAIRGFLAFAARVNFSVFVGLMGILIIATVVAQTTT